MKFDNSCFFHTNQPALLEIKFYHTNVSILRTFMHVSPSDLRNCCKFHWVRSNGLTLRSLLMPSGTIRKFENSWLVWLRSRSKRDKAKLWMTVFTGWITRSRWRSAFLMYHGHFMIILKTLFWHCWMISMFESLKHPHNWIA